MNIFMLIFNFIWHYKTNSLPQLTFLSPTALKCASIAEAQRLLKINMIIHSLPYAQRWLVSHILPEKKPVYRERKI